MVEVKFCGLTRPEDAAVAVALGARYAGVIFAGGPRLLTPARAREVLEPTRGSEVRRVGVFGSQDADEIRRIVDAVGLDIVQLHGGAPRDHLIGLRGNGGPTLWAVQHVRSETAWSDDVRQWFAEGAEAAVLDAAVAGQLGGTGVTLDWQALAPVVQALRVRGRIVLAGGLRPSNVAQAVAEVRPDVVDVSSGVERSPGVKDHELMRAFVAAAHVREGA